MKDKDLDDLLLDLDAFITRTGLDENDDMTLFGHEATAVYDDIFTATDLTVAGYPVFYPLQLGNCGRSRRSDESEVRNSQKPFFERRAVFLFFPAVLLCGSVVNEIPH